MKSIFLIKQFLFASLMVFFCGQVKAQSLLDKRVNELVDAMTTQEKINQLINSSFGGTPSNPRLGIPGFFMDDGPHGLRLTTDRNGRTATAFPTGVAIAATWDEEIAQKVGEAMGLEFWAFNRNQQLGPCVDLARDPRGGRSAESGGEDPYLAGHIGKAVAIGIQKHPIIATVKHYMGETKQVNRHKMDVLVTDRWMMDFAGYNFRTVVQDAGVMSLMGAYNLLNGEKACESTYLQTTVLRERWGYPFYVVSDWDAIWDSKKALLAGTDVCMGSNLYANDLPGLAASGSITDADLSRAAKRVVKTKILNGMLDYFPRGDLSYAKTPEINAVNKLAAQKSVILLKNEKKANGKPILPLMKKGIKVAVIGPNATAENLNCFGSSETFPPYGISVKKGIEDKIGAVNVTYSKGCDMNSNSRAGFAAAKALAAKADVVVFAGGLDATQEGEGFGTGDDRANGSIDLPGQQMQLINELSKINPNIVVVIQSGGVCGLNACISNIKGLIYSFYAAQEAGVAIADVMFGDYNPAGRMPVTMPKRDADLPSWEEESFRKFTENLDGGYRWFDEKGITPEFAFGFGLSYTTFAYSNLVVPSQGIAGQPFNITVNVTNTGKIEGEEVVQLYMSAPSSSELWMPKKQLRGFRRVLLQPGETKTVTFKMNAGDFYYWDGNKYVAQSGKFTMRVGGSSDNLPLYKDIVLTDGEKKPDLRITNIYTMPRYPLKGQSVSFYALVKNEGNASNKAGNPFSIDYNINGVKVASSENANAIIAPGQVQLIASTGVWDSDKVEKNELKGELAFSNINEEWDSENNTYIRTMEVFDPALDPATTNLAYRKPVITSSIYETNEGSWLVDGDYTSRWESGRTDNESVTVDLSLIAELSNVSIFWEPAYAKRYNIESSLDGTNWTILKTITDGCGGTESIAVNSVQARYVRISMLERIPIDGIKYGFSIYELVVNGNVLRQFPFIQLAPVESKLYLPYAKTIFNASQSGNPLKPEKLTYLWKQLSGPAVVQIEDSTSSLTLAKFSAVGTYEFQLTVGNDFGSNMKQFIVNVFTPDNTTDLAFMKPTVCSGVESSYTNSDMAVDDDSTTRWSSAFKENEWWQVDLQHQVFPSLVTIVWEGAYAKKFNVEISTDNKNWQTYYTDNAAKGETITIPNKNKLTGRYIKVNCVERATPYGSSFYTFNLLGSYVNSTNRVPVANGGGNIISTTGNATLNGNSSSDADNDKLTFKWEQIGGPSMATLSGSNASVAKVSLLKQGDYYFRLTVDDGKDVDFDVVKVVSK